MLEVGVVFCLRIIIILLSVHTLPCRPYIFLHLVIIFKDSRIILAVFLFMRISNDVVWSLLLLPLYQVVFTSAHDVVANSSYRLLSVALSERNHACVHYH